MEVFNQTVAVKDIQRLNDFIRDHMLEPRNWDEKVERLLGHFTLLTEAHESLVRVRQQLELLQPVARHGIEYQKHAGSLERAQRLLAAINAFFSQRTIDLFTPELELRLDELSRTSDRKDSLAREWETANIQSRSLQNEIEREGGERLRQIPVLIEKERACAETKSNERRRYRDALRLLEITEECEDENAFTQIQGRLPPIRRELDASMKRASDEKEQRTLERGDVRRDLTVLRQEWEGLKQRRENIPEWCVSLRLSLCQDLGLESRDFPFVAELIQVNPKEQAWEASIEKVLHNFALSMLVPERFYHLVSSHVDKGAAETTTRFSHAATFRFIG